MSYKTRAGAVTELSNYGGEGVIFRYTDNKRWDFATTGSGVYSGICEWKLQSGTSLIHPQVIPGSIPVDCLRFS